MLKRKSLKDPKLILMLNAPSIADPDLATSYNTEPRDFRSSAQKRRLEGGDIGDLTWTQKF